MNLNNQAEKTKEKVLGFRFFIRQLPFIQPPPTILQIKYFIFFIKKNFIIFIYYNLYLLLLLCK